ncbi:hypothetical protein IQ07DRAFT_323986 [Pyrenochaeta sp. DS3sAY3a]|nr:hypothetical protein IQ07DRAFT_323986 [Pyrenochaeta sp. DS3sAY3a]
MKVACRVCGRWERQALSHQRCVLVAASWASWWVVLSFLPARQPQASCTACRGPPASACPPADFSNTSATPTSSFLTGLIVVVLKCRAAVAEACSLRVLFLSSFLAFQHSLMTLSSPRAADMLCTLTTSLPLVPHTPHHGQAARMDIKQ